MEYLLVVVAVWGVLDLAFDRLEAPSWFWQVVPYALGVGGQCLIDYDRWWLGLGIGGLVALLKLITDLLLVTTDLARVAVLRRTNR